MISYIKSKKSQSIYRFLDSLLIIFRYANARMTILWLRLFHSRDDFISLADAYTGKQ